MTNRVIDLSTKPLSGLNDEEIVYLHVAGRSQEYTKDFIVISVLREINRNMKHTSGFNNSKTFAPALCAFAILDQIGSCYEDAAMAPYAGDEVNIKRALYYFAESLPQVQKRNIYTCCGTAWFMTHRWLVTTSLKQNGIFFDIGQTLGSLSKLHQLRGTDRPQLLEMALPLTSIQMNWSPQLKRQ